MKHYRPSLHSWLLSGHSSALEWIMQHSVSSSLPESAAQLLHPVLVCWLFTFPHSFTHRKCHLPPSLTRRADTYMSQVLEFSLCPLELHIGAGVWATFGSECESLNLLEWYYGGSQMDVILLGAVEPRTWWLWNILATVCKLVWVELGCVFYAYLFMF